MNDPVMEFTYKNHRGEIAKRRVIETALRFKETKWHPEPQWLVEAWCLDRKELGLFALADMHFDDTISFEVLCHDHMQWSEKTFGESTVKGPIGPTKHLKLECDEVIASPTDGEEYADLFLLVIDATRRAGFSPQDMIDNAYAKLAKIKQRTYKPDLANPDNPVEHERGGE